jgi:hypothetical protein
LELVAFSTATDFKRRRVATGGSPLRILGDCPGWPMRGKCPLLAADIHSASHMSAFGGKADMARVPYFVLAIATSSDPRLQKAGLKLATVAALRCACGLLLVHAGGIKRAAGKLIYLGFP